MCETYWMLWNDMRIHFLDYLFFWFFDWFAGDRLGNKRSLVFLLCYEDKADDGWRRFCAKVALLNYWGAGIGANVARKGIKLTPKNDSKMPSRNRRMTAKWCHTDRWSGERIWYSESEEKLHNLSKQTICAPCGTQTVKIWERPSPCVSWQNGNRHKEKAEQLLSQLLRRVIALYRFFWAVRSIWSASPSVAYARAWSRDPGRGILLPDLCGAFANAWFLYQAPQHQHCR